ncbi:hypothetical protein BGX23_012311 [Mortierella sp. AD031]|nr:hypothetical protein BGX23_012311 [Mortierella sp. AD031]
MARKQEQKEYRKAKKHHIRLLQLQLQHHDAPSPAPAPYRSTGTLSNNDFLEAVKLHSKHHAPYPNSHDRIQAQVKVQEQSKKERRLARKQQQKEYRKAKKYIRLMQLQHHHENDAHHQHPSDRRKHLKGFKAGLEHTHISAYQNQLHYHDQGAQPQPQVQPRLQSLSLTQQPRVPKSVDGGCRSDGYLKLSSKFFRRPLSQDYYSDHDDELDHYRQPIRHRRDRERERAGSAQ